MKLCNPVHSFILCVILGCLAALLIPVGRLCGGCRIGKQPRSVTCANNLRELFRLATVHAAQHKGQWPEAEGEKMWISFGATTPPFIGPDQLPILSCPVIGEECEQGRTHYRGPRVPFSQLQPSDPIAADKEGNHGEGETINVLLKSGMVVEVDTGDPLWKRCRDVLGP